MTDGTTMDEDLEKAIDDVGRGKVFAYARSIGWDSHASPPKWVWWGIVAELRRAAGIGEANRP